MYEFISLTIEGIVKSVERKRVSELSDGLSNFTSVIPDQSGSAALLK